MAPIFSSLVYNEVEGVCQELRKNLFWTDDTWRLQGYTAYGFEDNKFKYGLSGKWMVDRKNRIILSAEIGET
jgi:hypothetical protein